MFVQHADARILLRECPDRRSGERLVHRDPVHIDGRAAIGCDISSRGLCVIMTPPVAVGDIVRVTLAGKPGRVAEVTSPARVARVDRRSERCIVGLEFVN
jgi:hypothetical protein